MKLLICSLIWILVRSITRSQYCKNYMAGIEYVILIVKLYRESLRTSNAHLTLKAYSIGSKQMLNTHHRIFLLSTPRKQAA